jgi:hypothetical protein
MPHPGWHHSPEAKARIAAANVGRRHSPETRAKISAGQRGKQLGKTISPAHRAAVSAADRGREFSPQHCDRISEALIAYYARVSPPMSAKARQWREQRRLYKRALRARRKEKK